jgi:hypothetical protein
VFWMKILDRSCGGSMLSGSDHGGQVHEHTSETIGEEVLGPTKVRVGSRLMQVPVALKL